MTLSTIEYRRLVFRLLRLHRTCELCGVRRSESFHHVVPQGQGGDDCLENGAALCGDGTRLCHGRVEHDSRARAELRPRLRPEVVAYAVERKGQAWFDRRYPESRPRPDYDPRLDHPERYADGPV